MFTGIIEEIGSIEQIQKGVQSAVLSIQCKKVLEGTKIGDSIAVNGVCLTVTSMHVNGYTADVMAETLERSSLAGLKKGSRVNLECDIIGKYVERLCGAKKEEFKKSTMTREFLLENGF